MAATDANRWAALMGQEFERSEIQPLEPAANGAALRIGGNGQTRTLPLRVEKHPPDVLGPRFIDELGEDCVIRHAIPGLPRGGWTEETLCELREMLCAEPFRTDPVAAIADGDDWVGWMTRSRILQQPLVGDDELRRSFAERIYSDQTADGSWAGVPGTAYAILRLLDIGESAADKRIQRAANWLLGLPEPPPRPGM